MFGQHDTHHRVGEGQGRQGPAPVWLQGRVEAVGAADPQSDIAPAVEPCVDALRQCLTVQIPAVHFQCDPLGPAPEANIRGYKAGRFSFNVKGGRCENCQGDGVIKIEMHFLPDVYVQCEVCKGKRYNREALEITYKDKTIADVLEMTVEQAAEFFQNIPAIARKLDTLVEVGLGYIRLGQPATTFSGGEAQRIKLATELSRRATGKTLYILDEPTTGLHSADVKKLLHVLQALVNTGNSMVIIEHNLDVIKSADHIIDMGPEGGTNGGQVVAEGTPEEVAKNPKSYTGEYLKALL